MYTVLLIVLTILVPAVARAGPLVGSRAPEFSLLDQRGNRVTLRQERGKILVLVASDKEGMKQNPRWRTAINERYGDRVATRGVADLRKVPFFLKGVYRRTFESDPASIMLDWDGDLFVPYGMAADVSNIVVIDGEGFVRYRHSGSAEPEAVDRLFRVVDTLLEKEGE